ncbi:MAG: alpha/beta hydrolase, partial [Pyrinomonadaceae bacterium]
MLEEWAKEPGLPISQHTPDYVRETDKSVKALQDPPETIARVWEVAARYRSHEVPVKVYQPHASEAPLPIFIYIHGGGFVIGPESYESPIRAISNRSGYLV